MEITLEKIELVKDRTGVTYKEAKEALVAAEGSVVDAIIAIEESVNYQEWDNRSGGFSNNPLFKKIKRTAQKSNMSRIILRKNDKVLLDLPLTVGIFGVVVAPWGMIFATIAAAGFRCQIEFVNAKGQVTDVNGKVKSGYDKAVFHGQKMYDKGQETLEKIKDSELYDDVREKSQEIIDDIKDKGPFDAEKIKENLEEIKKKSAELFRRAENADKDFADFSDDDMSSVDSDNADLDEAEKTYGQTDEIDKVLYEVAKENGIDTGNDNEEKNV